MEKKSRENASRGALEGLLVLDLTSHLSGPYAAMMLADHGADVIKIEPPGGGDSARNMPPFINGESAPFMTWNRNKRSVALDFKNPDDKAALLDLVDRADILIENYRPGVMARLGLGWDVLHARNPRLIYGAISGFGQTGPYASRGGFDLITQGMSGLMSTNGPEDGPPHRLPIAISDVTAGMFLAFGLLAAVEARHRTGEGQFVETSLLEAATSLAVYESAHYFATGTRPARIGQQHRGSAPYRVFATSDGYITLGASQQKFFQSLVRPGRPAGTGRRSPLRQERRPRRQQRRPGGADPGEAGGETLRPLARRPGSRRHPRRPGAALRRGVHRPADPRPRHGG